tara:strand:+ start:381 stop:668 length:288 start_codon:yes stop_codon:yes gene_type:complete
MWWLLTIVFLLVNIFLSVIVYYSLKRITQYEDLISQFQQIIQFSTEKMKQVDADGHYESDDETGFFFQQLKDIQLLLDGVFETDNKENENAKKEK